MKQTPSDLKDLLIRDRIQQVPISINSHFTRSPLKHTYAALNA